MAGLLSWRELRSGSWCVRTTLCVALGGLLLRLGSCEQQALPVVLAGIVLIANGVARLFTSFVSLFPLEKCLFRFFAHF